MKTKLILILMAILLITSVHAYLEVSQTNININPSVNEEKTYSVNVTNRNNFRIYNIQFTALSGFTFTSIDQLEINETKQLNFTAKFTTPSTFTTTSTIRFFFYSNVSELSQTFNVTILDTGFNPTSIQIRRDDSIIFTNLGTISHTVTSTDFNYALPSNTSRTVVFPTIKSIDYWDANIGFHGTINVVSKQIGYLTTNPDNDITISFNINTNYPSTSISYELIENSFQVNYNGQTESMLKVLNTGSNPAINITLTGHSWLSFDENNFNLSSGNNNYLIFKIKPLIYLTSDTNKTHTLNINIMGANTNQISTSVSVNIPLHDFGEGLTNVSREELLEKIRILQKILEEYLKGQTTPEKIIEYRDTVIGVNYTEQDVLEQKTRLTNIEDVLTKSSSFSNTEISTIKTRIDNVEIFMKNVLEIVNTTKVMTEETKQSEKNRWSLTIFLIIMVLISGGLVALFIKMRQVKKKKKGLGL